MPLDQEDLEMFATYLGRISRALELIATRLQEGNDLLAGIDHRLEEMTDADSTFQVSRVD
jgi:hypothetical protein